MEEQKNQAKIRIIVLMVLGALTLYTLVVWVINYRTLEDVVKTAEIAAQQQTRNFRHYLQQYHAAKVALDEANLKVVELTNELQSANAELSTTRSELSSLQDLNDELKGSISSLEKYKAKAMAKGEALETMINAFKRKNRQLDVDLQLVRRELAEFKPDIADSKEGREKIVRFKDHIRMVKRNMGVLKEQALAMKIAAQEQRDRLETLYGNNGYLMKDGKDQSLKRRGATVDIKVEFK